MDSILIFLSLTVFTFAGYIVWPSRYNVIAHGGAAAGFIAILVPALILDVPHKYPQDAVSLYVAILTVGLIAFLPSFIGGFFLGRRWPTHFSFDVMDPAQYEVRAIKITKILLIVGVVGLALSYIGMGFVPVFAEDPIAAKLFRNQYQAPYYRVAVLFRSSWFILVTIIPVACIIWYKNRSKLFLLLISAAVLLMIASLQRSGAFGGIVFAFIVIMSFKSRLHFAVLMLLLVGIFIMSSFFYYIVGVRTFDSDRNIWEVIGESSPDIKDQLDFIVRFDERPAYTYGRTLYGGFVPGHYKWNPAVYTLLVINPDKEINEIESGGLRLATPLWGYVSFSWPGVVAFSLITGIFGGMFLGMLKSMFLRYDSIIIRMVAIVAFGNVFGLLAGITLLSFYNIPLAAVGIIYLYRIRWR